MPRVPSRPPVSRINPAVVKEAFRKPAATASGYYILERTKTSVCLRIRKRSVQIGFRHRSCWYRVAELSPEMSVQEIEDLRAEAVRRARALQDQESDLGFLHGRTMTVAKLREEFMADLRETRGDVLSPRTLKIYDDLWRLYLLPIVGPVRLSDLTVEVVRNLKRLIPAQAQARRPGMQGDGCYMANAALQQLSAALDFAFRMGWVPRNVASARLVPRYQKRRSEQFLDSAGYAAVGEVLRDLEKKCSEGQPSPLSIRTLSALRVVIYTGLRQRTELLWTLLEWCQFDDTVPRIGIPRAKGDRGGAAAGGRWIFLGPESVRLLRAIPRPPGSEHLTVPGDKPGQPLYRLNEAWWCVLDLAGLPRMTVKALRHSWSTHSVGVIAPEHRAQLLGHRGAKMTDTVYLHRHGPDLVRAAALVEEHLRGLLGDVPRGAARLLHFAAPSGAWGAS